MANLMLSLDNAVAFTILKSIDFHTYLPPYRSLLNPTARYDYRTHSLVPLSQNELNSLNATLRTRNKDNGNNNGSKTSGGGGSNGTFKMKYKSLLSDVSRSLSMRLSNPNLMASVSTTISAAAVAAAATVSSNASLSGAVGTLTLSSPSATVSQSQQLQTQVHQPIQFKNLPVEVLDYIFFLVDSKQDYKSCMYTCKLFYYFSKPYYYQHLKFTSTYRFAQFITYLRLNSEIGYYVKSIDLSTIKPGYDEDAEENINTNNDYNNQGQNQLNHPHQNVEIDFQDLNHSNDDLHNTHSRDQDDFIHDKILAGWRDWKFKNNPLYSIHPMAPSMSLTKISSNSQISVISNSSSHKSSYNSSSTSNKRFKPFKYFKSKKRSKNNRKSSSPPKLEYLNLAASHHHGLSPYMLPSQSSSSVLARNSSPHPLINKFLLNYSSSKDIPVGYILHLINLCPNIVSLDLGNISLSIDYEISRAMIYKFQTFDLMNNYPKDIINKIDEVMKLPDYFNNIVNHNSIFNEGDDLSTDASSLLLNDGTSNNNGTTTNSRPAWQSSSNLFKSTQSTSSAASSVYSITTFSKPIRKYNSLLPPLPQTVNDISYLNKGDGKVYLSDLNLKSINNGYLTKLNETELLSAIIRMHGSKSPLLKRNQKEIGNTYYNTYYTNMILNDANFTITNLKYINLSSMIWLNKSAIQRFLKNLISMRRRNNYYTSKFSDQEESDGIEYYTEDDSYMVDDTESGSEENSLYRFDTMFNPLDYKQDLVIDLTDSGMYKNLPWAKRIDLNTRDGCKLIHKIINDELYDPFQEYMRRERIRRGRIGENYLA
ncbi:uncharacterized protein RJT21DRAFT_129390 [Scheffersomyces amazonensis]|uniref:uncharacterized protein n=1 Tax=Scheffersomyces amazonensis TaxID=1078765 RepID=UPI00315D3FE3